MKTVDMKTVEESRSVRRRRVVRLASGAGERIPAPRPPLDEMAPSESTVDTAPAPRPDRKRQRPPARRRARAAARARAGDPALLRRYRLVAVLALVVLAGTLVAAGLAGRVWYDRQQLDTARQQALAAARQTTVNFVSISAATVDADLRRIADGATGQFKDEFTGDTAQLRGAILSNKVDSRGTVLRAAAVSVTRRSAVVLVAVDATVKNASAPDGRLSHYRIQVSLSRDARSGRWLVAQLQFVG